MTDSPEEAALIAAVCAQPADDLPRLIYADWLEEAGFAERAEQIRLQLALAEAKPWDAISIQHLRLDLGSYRRGFPWRMTVYDIPTLIRTLKSNAVLIGAIDVGTCPMNHWEDLVALPEFQQIEEIRFTGLTMPIEPLRVLRDAPNATGLTTLIFDRTNSPAFPEMIRELYLHPLGPRLKSLQMRFGQSGNEEDLFEAMTEHGQPIALEDFRYAGPLSLHRMNQRDGFLKVVRQVKRLELVNADLSGSGLELILSDRKQRLQYLNLSRATVSPSDALCIFQQTEASGIQWLDLRNTVGLEPISPHPVRLQLSVLNPQVLRLTSKYVWLRFLERKQLEVKWLDMSECKEISVYAVVEISECCDSFLRITMSQDVFNVYSEDYCQELMSTTFGNRLELIKRSENGLK